jgi:hypothetical protein
MDGITVEKIKSGFKKAAADLFGNKKGGFALTGRLHVEASERGILKAADVDCWVSDPENWYKVFPYQFVVVKLSGPKDNKIKSFFNYTLPIPPQQLAIKLVPASQATATVGGVVEETSNNVFWAIQMSGTTGTAIARSEADKDIRGQMASRFRERLQTTGEFAGVFSNLGAISSKVGGSIDALKKGLSGGGAAGIINGVAGSLNNAFLPTTQWSGSAVDVKSNGFEEIQEFHRFLHVYSKLKGAFPREYSLWFYNHKTGQKWQVILQDFSIQQSSQNPHLYRYNVQLKGWNISGISAKEQLKEFDRFGVDGDLKSVNTMSVKKTAENLKKLNNKMWPPNRMMQIFK